MNNYVEGLCKFVDVAEYVNVEYVLIGAAAVGVHTIPRTTQDIDFIAHIEKVKFYRFLEGLTEAGFAFDKERVEKQYKEGYFIEISYRNIPIDILLTSIPIFYKAIKQAMSISIFNKNIKVAKEEDLIILKLLSARQTDRADIQQIKEYKVNLDLDYIEENLVKLVGKGSSIFLEFCRIFKKDERA